MISALRLRAVLGAVFLAVVVVVCLGARSAVSRAELDRKERTAEQRRIAHVVRGVIDESLEELRIRESARPFDHYNAVYVPEGVLAASDALAPSPLSTPPDDARLLGWAQVNPDGSLTLPFDERAPALAARVRARLDEPAFAPLLQLARAPRAAGTAEQGVVQQLNMLQNAAYAQLKDAEPEPQKRAALASAKKAIPKIARKDDLGFKEPKGAAPFKTKEKTEALLGPPPTPLKTDEVALAYTPMTYVDLSDGGLALQRTLGGDSDDATRTAQLVLFDQAGVRAFIDGVAKRHAPGVPIVAITASATCADAAPVSSVVDELALCFPAVSAASAAPEVAVLTVLLLAAGAALVLVERAAARTELLARQRAGFVSSVSHELRTPLTTLRLHAELLRDELVTDEAKRKTFLDDMVRESVRLSHLVENVLEAQRLEDGRRPLRLEDADACEVVRAACDGQRALLEHHGVTLSFDGERAPASIDRQAVEQIVVNVLENAVKYGRVAGRGEVRVTVRLAGEMVRIMVADRGGGVDRDQRERAFRRFERLARPDESHIGGSGLGLALVRELARAHHGSADLIDAPDGIGCVVRVLLPIAPAGAS